MTVEEIRAEAIERVARADFAYTEKFMGRAREWDAAMESDRKFHREIATVAVDALGDLLPTEIEHLAAYGADASDDRLMQRYVTAWTDAPE